MVQYFDTHGSIGSLTIDSELTTDDNKVTTVVQNHLKIDNGNSLLSLRFNVLMPLRLESLCDSLATSEEGNEKNQDDTIHGKSQKTKTKRNASICTSLRNREMGQKCLKC